MTVQNHTRSGAVAVSIAVLVCAMQLPSKAQTPSAALELSIDNLSQMRAEQAWRLLREQRVFSKGGRWLGRVEDVKISPSDGTISASLRLRPRFGGGQAWVPIQRFRQTEGRVVVTETIASLKGMIPGRSP
jgi:sporulation protein YlmC with PRC-barrel domain